MKTQYLFPKRMRQALALLTAVSFIATITPSARAQTPAELIEKGIYTEETRGDLSAALEIYQQALDQAKSNEAFAAQALLRLALCHRKLGHTAEANTLLERLIKDYPDQEEFVAQARELLPGELPLQPIPWQDRERMILQFRFPAGAKIGMTAYYAYQVHGQEPAAWMVGQRTFVGHHNASSVLVAADTFRPLQSIWKHTLIGEASAEFSPTQAKITTADGQTRTVNFEKTTYDNEQAVHLIRRLPLAPGYEADLPIITTLGGGTLLSIRIKTSESDPLTVPAGTFPALKVDLLPVNQSFWLSNDENRYLLRMEAGGVIGELVKVEHLQPGQPNLYSDDELGFSFNVPAEWITYKGEPTEEKGRVRVAILGPEAAAHCMLFAYPRSSLKPELQSSLKAWAEERAAHGAKQVADFKIRPESWTESTIGGLPALSFIADFTEGENKDPRVHYCLVTMSQDVAASFFMMVDADEFASIKTQFDQIIASFIVR